MARPEKERAVGDIAARFSESDAALLTEYRGLTVTDIAEVRSALRDTGAEYKVLKNTLTRIAVRDIGLEDLADALVGPTAIAFVKGDVAAAAKALDEAARRFPVLVIKGGVLDGRPLTSEQARALATLESREVLLSKVAMLVNSPAQQAVNVFAALLRNLGSMLVQVVEKKESGELPSGGSAAATAGEDAQPSGPGAAEAQEVPGDEAQDRGQGVDAGTGGDAGAGADAGGPATDPDLAEVTDGPPPAQEETPEQASQSDRAEK